MIRTNGAWRHRQVVGGLLLTVVTLFGAALRIDALREPLWVDELHTGWVVADGLGPIAQRAASGNQAATYFYLPWLSTRLLGQNPLALRLPSLVAGSLLVPGCAWLVWRATRSTSASLLAALLIALDGDCVFYAVEARVYAILQLAGVLQIALFARRLERPLWWNRLGWSVLGVLLFYLHYTASLVIAAECCVLAVALATRGRCGAGSRVATGRARSFVEPLAELAILALGVAFAGSHLAEVTARRQNWAQFLQPPLLSELFAWRTYVVAPLVGLAIAAAWRGLRREGPWLRWSRVWRVAVWGAIALLPILFALVATRASVAQLLSVRYLIVPVTVAILCAALAVSLAPSRPWRTWLAVAVLAAACPSSEFLSRLTLPADESVSRREDWQAAIAHIEALDVRRVGTILLCPGLVEDGELVVAAPSVDDDPIMATAAMQRRAEVVEFCRFPLRSVWKLDWPDEQIVPIATRRGPRLLPATRQQVSSAGEAWLIVRGSTESTRRIVAGLQDELLADGHRLEADSLQKFGRLVVVRLTIE